MRKDELLRDSKVFCMAPWTHLQIATDGKVFPCCSADLTLPLGSLHERTLEDIWESDALKRMRLNMLAGKESAECRTRCYKLENAGSPSMRHFFNTSYAHHFAEVGTTRPDGGVARIHLPYLDIRFSNQCNFRCRICHPLVSSNWYAEGKLLGKVQEGDPQFLRALPDTEDFMRHLEPVLPQVEEINFAGGEPLIMEEHYRLLRLLIEKKLFHVRLKYNTNFSEMRFKGLDVMALWDQFEKVELYASLDGEGRRGEYLRKGQDWAQVVANRKRMFEACPRTRICMTSALGAMNALHLTDLHSSWVEKGYISPSDSSLIILIDPEEYSLQVLPRRLKERVAEKLEGYAAALPEKAATSKSDFLGAVNFMMAQDRTDLLAKFRESTRALDKLRGESFADTFPELAELMSDAACSDTAARSAGASDPVYERPTKPDAEAERLLRRSPVFCMAPWMHLAVRAEGRIVPCCAATLELPVGDLRVETLENAWNGEAMRRLRGNMLAGTESPECRGCYQEEKTGNPNSLRNSFNTRFAHRFPAVKETSPDGGVPGVGVTYLDVAFSNLCNLRCRICGPHNSTQWYDEAKRLGSLAEGAAQLLRPTEDPQELMRQLEPLLPQLEKIRFSSAGEPLMMDEHYRLLDLMIEKKLFHIRLFYSTNLSALDYKGRDVAALWDRFESVRVTASLDAMGARGEYLRKGLDWAQVVRNRERLSAACPRVDFVVAPTVSVHNSLHVTDFHRSWSDAGFIEPWNFHVNILRTPPSYSLRVLPRRLKDQVAEKYARHAAGLPGSAGVAKAEFEAAVVFMMEQDDSGLLKDFRDVTGKLDRYRDEKFADVFPELAELMDA